MSRQSRVCHSEYAAKAYKGDCVKRRSSVPHTKATDVSGNVSGGKRSSIQGDKMTTYTFKDFITRRLRHTHGIFEGWTEPTGPLSVRFAQFKTPRNRLFVPIYLLTAETRARLPDVSGGK